MEVLACNLRAHPDLGVIKIPNSSVSLPVVSLYADDTSAIVTSNHGIKAVFDTYSRFAACEEQQSVESGRERGGSSLILCCFLMVPTD